MRLLLVSHSYLLAEMRGKIRALNRLQPTTLVTPQTWPSEYGWQIQAQNDPDASLQVRSIPTYLAGRIIRFVFPFGHLARVLAHLRPEVVLVEQEPASLALLQFSLLKAHYRYKLFFFAWENILWQPRLTKGVEYLNYHYADGALVGSAGAAEVLRQKKFKGAIAVVPQMGAPDAWLEILRQPPPETPFTIAYTGRLLPSKGLAVLFAALKDLTGPWRLQLIGNGPMESQLRMLAERGGFTRHVQWLGYKPRSELPQHWQQAHVLVLPSRTTPHWKEQFGRVLVEAMALGVPVIGSNSGAIPEVIGDAGGLYPEADSATLCEKLQVLRATPEQQHRFSEAGRQRVRDHYADSVIAQRLNNFLVAQS